MIRHRADLRGSLRVGPLAVNLARFLNVVGTVAGHEPLLADHLRFPRGYEGIFTGSELGAALWSTPEGVALLNLIGQDEAIRQAYDGKWDPEDDARRTLANVVIAWQGSNMAPGAFAAQAEADLWSSLRRTEVQATALALVSHLQVPESGIELPFGRRILWPSDDLLATWFSRLWPSYQIRRPRDPHCILVVTGQASRADLPASAIGVMAVIGAHRIRDAIWLATGGFAKIGEMVTLEHHRFPVFEAHYEPPERRGDRLHETIDLAPFAQEIVELSARVGVLEGEYHESPEFEEHTKTTLDTLRALAGAAANTADTSLALLLAFTAAEGSLTDQGEPSDVVPARYGLLCGRDTQDTRRLRELMKRLDPIRDAAAHGNRPTNNAVARVLARLGTAGATNDDAPWFPPIWDRTQDTAHTFALDIIRRLYRAWLLATMDLVDGEISPTRTRAEVIALIRAANDGDSVALNALRRIHVIGQNDQPTP